MNDRDRQKALDALQVAAWRGGDETALAALLSRRRAVLLLHARRLSDDAETAADILQGAWIEIWRGLKGLRDDAAFLAFALRIVTRQAARAVRSRKAQRQFLAAAPGAEGTTPDGAAALDIHNALARLTVEDRALVSLALVEELNGRELATALGIPVGTVKSRLHLVRKKLRTDLKETKDDL